MREGAIGLVIELDELERQMRLQQIHDQPRTAVAGVHHHLQRSQPGGLDVTEQVLHVALADIQRPLHALLRGRRRQRARGDGRPP